MPEAVAQEALHRFHAVRVVGVPVAARLLSTSVTMIAAAQMAARRLAALRFFKLKGEVAASVVKVLASKQSSKPL